MSYENAILTLCVAALLAVFATLIKLFYRPSWAHIDQLSGSLIMKRRIWSALAIDLALIIAILVPFIELVANDMSDIYIVNVIRFACITLCTLVLLGVLYSAVVTTLGTTYEITNDGLIRRRLWSKDKFIPWRDIHTIRYFRMPLDKEFMVKSSTGTMRLHFDLKGIKSFAAAVKTNLQYEVWKPAEKVINKLSVS